MRHSSTPAASRRAVRSRPPFSSPLILGLTLRSFPALAGPLASGSSRSIRRPDPMKRFAARALFLALPLALAFGAHAQAGEPASIRVESRTQHLETNKG